MRRHACRWAWRTRCILSLGDPGGAAGIAPARPLRSGAQPAATICARLAGPIIECYLGGACARALEDAGPQAAFAFAIDELRQLLGDNSLER